MDSKMEELKKRFEALEKERQTLLEKRATLEKQINDIVVEQIRIDGGVRVLQELEQEKPRQEN